MNRDLATEVVRRTWPSDGLRFFVDGYLLALEDVLKDYKMYEEQGLITEGFVDTLIESIRQSRDEALVTMQALADLKLLEHGNAEIQA